ncbi:glutamate--tRNA ligase [Marinilabiliaceae bacterium ANBcel2]|nr:glutamate--tRNA ligase [Marinilabiliaceae bacterium ANBcel2]
MTNKNVRVRFAPSPTGPLHIGGVRTALFNWLFAKKYNGTFILRIEDTDSTRFVPGAEEYISESLKWLGLTPDEGVNEGGKYGPYRQSERKSIYHKYALKLIESGNAYYAFDTSGELDKIREEYEAEKKSFSYNSNIRESLNNSLSLSKEETLEKLNSGTPYVIRFKMPLNQDVKANDMIRGDISFNSSTLDDKVLYKSSDQLPTYHLANVVDDHLMKISHVIRGEEWLPSLPLHILLHRALGWEDDLPEFAHLPLILKPGGKGKLSKRDGDKHGFPVFPIEYHSPTGDIAAGYREEGYFPEAVNNLLALLGWNPGTTQEIFSLKELVKEFSFDKVNKAGAKFDPEKAAWFNHQYLINKSDKELASLFMPILQKKGVKAAEEKVADIINMVKERVNFVHELWEQTSFFFKAPESYDPKIVKKRWKGEVPQFMEELAESYSKAPEWRKESLKELTSQTIKEKGLNFGNVMNALRLSLVGGAYGPDLFTIAEMLGREESVERVRAAVKKLN